MSNVVSIFGQRTAGLGAGEAGDEPAAGAPAPGSQQTAGDLAADLEQALLYARTATNRLVNLPAPGAVLVDREKQLLTTFADLESQIRNVVDRLQQSGEAPDVVRDASLVQQHAMDYVNAVEAELQKAGVPAGATKPVGGRKINWLVWGTLAASVGLAGFTIYKAATSSSVASTKRPVKPRKIQGLKG